MASSEPQAAAQPEMQDIGGGHAVPRDLYEVVPPLKTAYGCLGCHEHIGARSNGLSGYHHGCAANAGGFPKPEWVKVMKKGEWMKYLQETSKQAAIQAQLEKHAAVPSQGHQGSAAAGGGQLLSQNLSPGVSSNNAARRGDVIVAMETVEMATALTSFGSELQSVLAHTGESPADAEQRRAAANYSFRTLANSGMTVWQLARHPPTLQSLYIDGLACLGFTCRDGCEPESIPEGHILRNWQIGAAVAKFAAIVTDLRASPTKLPVSGRGSSASGGKSASDSDGDAPSTEEAVLMSVVEIGSTIVKGGVRYLRLATSELGIALSTTTSSYRYNAKQNYDLLAHRLRVSSQHAADPNILAYVTSPNYFNVPMQKPAALINALEAGGIPTLASMVTALPRPAGRLLQLPLLTAATSFAEYTEAVFGSTDSLARELPSLLKDIQKWLLDSVTEPLVEAAWTAAAETFLRVSWESLRAATLSAFADPRTRTHLLLAASISSFSIAMHHEMAERKQQAKFSELIASGNHGDFPARKSEPKGGRGVKRVGVPSSTAVKATSTTGSDDTINNARPGDSSMSIGDNASGAMKRQRGGAAADASRVTPTSTGDNGVRSKLVCKYFGNPGMTCIKGTDCRFLHPDDVKEQK